MAAAGGGGHVVSFVAHAGGAPKKRVVKNLKYYENMIAERCAVAKAERSSLGKRARSACRAEGKTLITKGPKKGTCGARKPRAPRAPRAGLEWRADCRKSGGRPWGKNPGKHGCPTGPKKARKRLSHSQVMKGMGLKA